MSEQKRKLELMKSSGEDLFGEKSKELEAAVRKLKSEIDQLVFRLYGLTKEEVQQIESIAGEE